MASPHIRPALCDMESVLDNVMQVLAEKEDSFNTVVVCGVSGLLVGSPLVLRLKKQLIVVRKRSDVCHSTRILETECVPSRWIFLDDLVSSGRTYVYVRRAIVKEYPGAQFVGTVLYNKNEYDSEAEFYDPDHDFGADVDEDDGMRIKCDICRSVRGVLQNLRLDCNPPIKLNVCSRCIVDFAHRDQME